jgi:hypothetical protein
MIGKDLAIKQIARLSGLSGFPGEPEAKRELVIALRSCLNDEHAERLITEWIQSYSFTPKPAEIRRIAFRMQEPKEYQMPTDPGDHCQECRDWGSNGWVEREHRFERCSQPHGAYVPGVILDMLNHQWRRANANHPKPSTSVEESAKL